MPTNYLAPHHVPHHTDARVSLQVRVSAQALNTQQGAGIADRSSVCAYATVPAGAGGAGATTTGGPYKATRGTGGAADPNVAVVECSVPVAARFVSVLRAPPDLVATSLCGMQVYTTGASTAGGACMGGVESGMPPSGLEGWRAATTVPRCP